MSTVEDELEEYHDIFNSLLASQNQWTQVPEIVVLALKALGKCLQGYTDKTTDLRHQIDLMRGSVNDLQMNKAAKRDLDRLIDDTKFMMDKGHLNSEEDRSASVDFKFRREEGLDRTMIQEVKTIALALIEERIANFGENQGERLQQILDTAVHKIKKQFAESIEKISAQATPKQLKYMQHKSQTLSHVTPPPSRWEIERQKLNEQLKMVKSQLAVVSRSLQNKIQKNCFDEEIKAIKLKIKEEPKRDSPEVQGLRKLVEQLLVKKADLKEVQDFKSKILKEIASRVKLQEIEQIIKSLQSEQSKSIDQAKAQIRKIEKQFQKTLKFEMESLTTRIRKQSPPQKKNSSIAEIKSSLFRVEKKIHERLKQTRQNTQSNQIDIRQDVDKQVKLQLDKQWIKVQEQLSFREKKICQTIQQAMQTNRASLQNRPLKPKAKQTQLALSILCKELIVGKWTCSSLALKGGLIPWQSQVSNTNKDNFIWQQGNTNILIVAPGVYRLDFGFFSIHKNDASVLLNGQSIFKIKEEENKAVNRKHPNGCIAGNSCLEIIVLPAQGRIAIEMSKETTGEAYLSLFKM